jgi:hypothetical protein
MRCVHHHPKRRDRKVRATAPHSELGAAPGDRRDNHLWLVPSALRIRVIEKQHLVVKIRGTLLIRPIAGNVAK